MNPLEILESLCMTAEHTLMQLSALRVLGRLLYHVGLLVSPSDSEAYCFVCGYPRYPYKLLRNEE